MIKLEHVLFTYCYCFFFYPFFNPKKRTKNPKVSLFPNSWVEYTVKHVKFFNKLSSIEQEEFENRIVNFINSTRIIGYGNMSIKHITVSTSSFYIFFNSSVIQKTHFDLIEIKIRVSM